MPLTVKLLTHDDKGAADRGKYRQAAGAGAQGIKVTLALKKAPTFVEAEFTSNALNAQPLNYRSTSQTVTHSTKLLSELAL